MNRFMGLGLLAAITAFSPFLPVRSQEQESFAARERPAYIAMVRADRARDAGRWEEAIDAYREAEELFVGLAEAFPDVKGESVRYRIDYCRAQAERIQSRVSDPSPATGAADPAWSGTGPTESAVPIVGQETAEDRSLRMEFRLLELEEENRLLISQSAERAVQADEIRAARQETHRLRRDLDAARQAILAFEADRGGAGLLLEAARAELETLKGEHLKMAAAAAQTLEDLAAGKKREDEAALRIRDMERDMADLRKENAGLSERVKALSALQSELSDLRSAVAAFGQERETWMRSTADLRRQAEEADELRRRLVAADLDRTAWIRSRGDLERQMGELRARLAKSENERDDSRRAWQQARDRQAAMHAREKDSREQEYRDLWQRLSRAVRERDQAQAQNDEWAEQLEETRRNLQRSLLVSEAFESRIQVMEAELRSLREASNKALSDPVSE